VLLAQQDVPQDGGGDTTLADTGGGATSIDSTSDSAADSTAADGADQPGETQAEVQEEVAQTVAQTVAATEDSAAETGAASPVRKIAESNLLESFKNMFSSLPDYALKIAAGLLGLLAVLFLWLRRKSHKEFDTSMLDIETE